MRRIFHGILEHSHANCSHAHGSSGVAHVELLAQVCNEQSEVLQDKLHFLPARLGRSRRLVLCLEQAIDSILAVRGAVRRDAVGLDGRSSHDGN